MTIDEIRLTRVEAERVIFEVLRVFKETTGMAVIGVDVHTQFSQIIERRRGEIILIGVDLEIESI